MLSEGRLLHAALHAHADASRLHDSFVRPDGILAKRRRSMLPQTALPRVLWAGRHQLPALLCPRDPLCKIRVLLWRETANTQIKKLHTYFGCHSLALYL